MERRRAVAVSNVRRSKSLLFDYMHIGALIEDPKTQISRRRSISSIVRENKDLINDFDDFSSSALDVSVEPKTLCSEEWIYSDACNHLTVNERSSEITVDVYAANRDGFL